MVDKLIKDGKVAVIVSPGYGAGWSTWCSSENRERAVFDPVLAQAIIDGKDKESLQAIARERFPKEYLGGLDLVRIKWLDPGTEFYIDEYDGAESVITEVDFTYIA